VVLPKLLLGAISGMWDEQRTTVKAFAIDGGATAGTRGYRVILRGRGEGGGGVAFEEDWRGFFIRKRYQLYHWSFSIVA
jgi:hypothetical protein